MMVYFNNTKIYLIYRKMDYLKAELNRDSSSLHDLSS